MTLFRMAQSEVSPNINMLFIFIVYFALILRLCENLISDQVAYNQQVEAGVPEDKIAFFKTGAKYYWYERFLELTILGPFIIGGLTLILVAFYVTTYRQA